MKKLLVLKSILLLVTVVTACTGASVSTEPKLIEPGDKIGDFTVTTGVPGKFSYGFTIQCVEQEQGKSYTCNVPVGEAINVSTGIYDTSGSGKLEEVWAHSNYQMFINDQPVDLKAFGTVDYIHPQMGAIRFGNVVIITDKPGEITVRDSGLFDNGDPFSSTSMYVFSES